MNEFEVIRSILYRKGLKFEKRIGTNLKSKNLYAAVTKNEFKKRIIIFLNDNSNDESFEMIKQPDYFSDCLYKLLDNNYTKQDFSSLEAILYLCYIDTTYDELAHAKYEFKRECHYFTDCFGRYEEIRTIEIEGKSTIQLKISGEVARDSNGMKKYNPISCYAIQI